MTQRTAAEINRDTDRAIERIRAGDTLDEIAALLAVSRPTIASWMRRRGVRVANLRTPLSLDALPREPGEQWRTSPDDPKYAVSSHGRVARIAASRRGGTRPGHILKASDDGASIQVDLAGRDRYTVASLVARAFIGPRPERERTYHRDRDYRNNCVENLYYSSAP